LPTSTTARAPVSTTTTTATTTPSFMTATPTTGSGLTRGTDLATSGASGTAGSGPGSSPGGSSGLAFTGTDLLRIVGPGLGLLAVGEVSRQLLRRRRRPAGIPST
jgi:hypothetical protein